MLTGTIEPDGGFWVHGTFGLPALKNHRIDLDQWENTELEQAIKGEVPVVLHTHQEIDAGPLGQLLRLDGRDIAVVFPFSKFRLTVGATLITFKADSVEMLVAAPEVLAAVWGSELFCTRSRRTTSVNKPTFGQELTPRQSEIIRLCREGLTNIQIARQLHLSESSIKQELTRIFRKWGVSSRAELDEIEVEEPANSNYRAIS